MRRSRLTKGKQDQLLEHFVAGTTARCAASLVSVNKNTAAYYYHRLREVIAHRMDLESAHYFSGEIEVDESYFGGERKGKSVVEARGWTLWKAWYESAGY